MPFFRGQQVVYIGPDFSTHALVALYSIQIPLPGKVYTIRSPELLSNGSPGYLLEEIYNPNVTQNGQEMLVDAKWLRPVVTIKDHAFFTEGAPPDTKGLDNRHKRKQKVWQIKLPHGFAELQLARGLEDLERYRAKWEQARKATS